MTDITTILIGFILIVSGFIGFYAVKWLKAHVSVEQLNMITGCAQTVVYAAEKIFGAKMGPDKKAYAVAQLKKWLESKHITFDEEAVNAVIEAEVQKLDIQFHGA